MRDLFGEGLFGAPEIGLSIAGTVDAAALEITLMMELSGLSGSELIISSAALGLVTLPALSVPNLRSMPWAKLSG